MKLYSFVIMNSPALNKRPGSANTHTIVDVSAEGNEPRRSTILGRHVSTRSNYFVKCVLLSEMGAVMEKPKLVIPSCAIATNLEARCSKFLTKESS